ncbi:hypothetical protein [Bacillus smithii]|uniref:hypothetical protein n=1 Tax=Bacillus smithii TaxID=1479 RepID=UPI002E23CD8E|nr:hypothetical protein [Bacillus smithii]MED4928275.1 hypothetical protein [Bacillus smithii]
MKRQKDNKFHEAKVNPFKNYYTLIEVDGKEYVETYEAKFRSEAKDYFYEVAKQKDGKFNPEKVYVMN